MQGTYKKGIAAAVLLCCLCTLSACGRVKEELGLTRHTPDEFMVTTRAPLEMPADLNDLPSPRPGAPRPQEVTAVAQAKEAVIGKDQTTHAASESGAEQLLLQKTGANQTQSNIRDLVNKEAAENNDDNRPVVKRLLSIGKDDQAAKIVDPAAEAERIKKAKESGQPITTGETPTLDE